MSDFLSSTFLFIFGAVLGSFLNVVALRYVSGEAITGRSACPHCDSKLAWYDLIPIISFFLLRARCRRCRAPISWQYPAVEVAMGILAISVSYPWPVTFNEIIVTPLYVGIAAILLVLFVIDWKVFLLPDIFILILAALVIGVRIVVPLSVFSSLLGVAIGVGFLGGLWLLTRGKGIGLGDVKLLIPLGLLFGAQATAVLLFVSFMIGGLFGLVLLASKRVGLKSAIPFGPFLTGVALLFLVWPSLPQILINTLLF